MDDAGTPFPVREFAIALFVGAVVGIERERRAKSRKDVGGIRTFTIIALVGALAAWLTRALNTPWVFVAAVGGVAAAVVVSHATAPQRVSGRGLTTEVAAIAVCLLGGASVLGYAELAVAGGVVVAALLAFKGPLHGFVGKIGEHDLYAALKLLIVALIVVPRLPDRTVDPWEAVNPHQVGWLIVILSTVSFLGYVAVRLVGTERGVLLTGVLGALASSTAVTLSLARSSRADHAEGAHDTLAAGILLAWTVMCARIIAVAAVINRQFVMELWPAIAAMGVASLAVGVVFGLRGRSSKGAAGELALRNPFSLWEATKFALVFTAIALVVAIAQKHFPPETVYVVATLAGTTDVDAITVSMAKGGSGGAAAGTAAAAGAVAVGAVVLAAMSNTIVKAIIGWVAGSRPLGVRVATGAGAMIAAGAAAWAIAASLG